METQTQSKASVNVPKNGRVVTDADQYEDSMTDLDDFDLAKIFEYYSCIKLSEEYKQQFYEYTDISNNFKEEHGLFIYIN